MTKKISLTGKDLTPSDLRHIAYGAGVDLAPEALSRMQTTNNHLVDAISLDQPMYGITTGLGPRVVERLDADAQSQMSLNTVRGRAHAVGDRLPVPIVRAAMAIRLNTLLTGASGSRPALAQHIAACLDADLTPLVRETGSIGAADLMWGASMGLPLLGEGTMLTAAGPVPASEALASAGIAPFQPGPREGLALANHSSFTYAFSALGLVQALNAIETAQTAAALSLEGFRANLSPFDPRVLALRSMPGQARAAEGVLSRLAGSELLEAGHARRVQDPLSFRNVPQVHGAVFAAISALDQVLKIELNGSPDNPVVLKDSGDVLSSGHYLVTHLAITLGAVNQSLMHLAAAQVARMSKQVHPRFTDLPVGLAAEHAGTAGFAPAMKTAEALFAEIAHLALPPQVYPAAAADTVEDVLTNAPVAAKALEQICDRLARLSAMELMIAAQHVELRAPARTAPAMQDVISRARETVAPLTGDRSLSEDIEALTQRICSGGFAQT